MTAMYDDGSVSHSYLGQLPTPRSSIESREPIGRPPNFIGTAKERESPINPEDTLQTPRSRTTSLDIPTPVVKLPLLRTHDRVGVVDSIKYYITEHESNVQEFQGVGLEEFNQIHDILSDSRFRYDFDADLKTLTIRMPYHTHEVGASELSRHFADSMIRQKKACGRKLPWCLGTNLESRLEVDDGSGSIASKFISDLTIHDEFNKPRLLGEVAHTQTRNNVHKKITKRMATIPSLIGSIVVNVDESPVYSIPAPASPNDYIDQSTWKDIVEEAPMFGPIKHQGRCWMGSIKCSFDVSFKGEAKLRVKQAQIIPMSNTDELDAALQDLWDRVVEAVAGVDTDPVSFAMDWADFRDEMQDSLSRTAYGRYVDWFGSYGAQPKEASNDS